MDIQRTYYTGMPRGRTLRWRMYFTAIAAVCMLQSLSAQDLINSGTLTNNGRIRVKNQAIITQGSVGGEIELTGADQNLPAKQYRHVRLSGTGTKTTTGGNLTVLGNLTIAAPVTLNIAQGNIVTLGDTLFESGTLRGAIQKSVNLTGSTTSSHFGNIGATIGWSSNAPGITNVIRVSDSIQTGNGNESIKRYYAVFPADTLATGDITLKFSDSELNGHDPRLLRIWRSLDNGQNWYHQGGTVDTVLRTITRTNAALSGRWTMADTLHPIGSFNAPGIPTTMIAVNASQPVGVINTQAAPFSVVVRDQFSGLMKNIAVTFFVDSIPAVAGATRPTFSDTVVFTDDLGIARTNLTFGNKAGIYYVHAAAGSLPPVYFTAKALHGSAFAANVSKGNNQSKRILTTLDSLFMVSVIDVGGNPVDSVAVQFTIASVPQGATGQQLSVQTALTDTLGRASTVLTLGNKIDEYIVHAAVNGVSGPPVVFSATAIPGNPSTMLAQVGNNQQGLYGTRLSDPFTVVVMDAGSNPVPGETVTFTITEPESNYGQTLSAATVATSVTGQASTYLTLGLKSGDYTVAARSTSLGGVLLFHAEAREGAAASLTAVAGINQTEQILTALDAPFVVQVQDAVGNPVRRAMVSFEVDTVPVGAVGTAISDSVLLSDSLGRASVTLTLGSKVGTYTFSAIIAGIDTVTFTATATHGAAALFTDLAGQNQIKPTGALLDTAFVLSVRDIGGNPVPDVPVRFAVISSPANAIEYSLSDSVRSTDSAGIAYTYLQLGDREGTYVIGASTQGVPQAQFTASGYYIYGDINRDFFVNIADITSIIDFFNKKKVLSATDSLKADFDRDGNIKIADLDSIRENILRRGIPLPVPQPSLAEGTSSLLHIRRTDNVENTKAIREASTLLETTPLGLRVNLQNAIPIRGIELRMRLNDSTVNINAVNLMLHRSKSMNVFVRTEEQVVRVIMYNLSNEEISPDSSSLFRLPGIYALGAIDTSQAIFALQSNTAAVSDVFMQVAPAGKYPTTFSLGQNYPNPFNSSTTIEYDIADGMKGSKIILQVFNILGQRIKTLVAGEQDPGHYKIRWDGTNDAGISVASGVYFYRLLTKDHGGSRKMLFIK